MGVFEMVVAIVAISVIGGVINKSIKASIESKKMNRDTGDDMTAKRLADFEKRLIVLEQIVTSESYELKQKFKDIDDE